MRKLIPWMMGLVINLLYTSAFADQGGFWGSNWAVLDPKGPVAAAEKHLILTAFGLMLIVVIPVIVMTIAFAWHYRADNKAAKYDPKWDNSHTIEWVVWSVPAVIILVLGTIVWQTSHELSPEKPIASANKTLEIEVVSMDWKWLFIYPEQGVASVNDLVIPANTPVHFKITSDSVMNSFFIPQLGGQIYAMAGMQTNLNLFANETGVYRGMDAMFNGEGFSGMSFPVTVATNDQFNNWINQVHSEKTDLNVTQLRSLEVPSDHVKPIHFATVTPYLFESVIMKYMGNDASTLKAMASYCSPNRLVNLAQGH
ncbi:MAG: ubiquinol oxidase subunit II [Betaproteobacteria bacterium]|nr:ubiquinol oxidase subunit II [Betaproteobacteria bacterium]MDE2056574.1 ubiquinol oxidase subunit II [Betaproteobacteria bacterium]